MKRNKGAQPGNRNARKHGFYSKVMTRSEKLELQKAVSVEGLGDEIALLRLKIFQLLERDPDNLNLVLQASDILGRLVHINYLNPLPSMAIRFICHFSLIRFKISLSRFSENLFFREDTPPENSC